MRSPPWGREALCFELSDPHAPRARSVSPAVMAAVRLMGGRVPPHDERAMSGLIPVPPTPPTPPAMNTRRLIIGCSALAVAAAAGGGAIAVAGAGDDQSIVGYKADQARAAALRYTGGGSAGLVEPESNDPDEAGARYGVGGAKPDGHKVDVFLDGSYKLLRITSNEDG